MNPNLPAARAGAAGRSAEQIRRDIGLQRNELAGSMELLRGRVNTLTDWRSQAREHRKELIVGVTAVGFLVGGMLALRRR